MKKALRIVLKPAVFALFAIVCSFFFTNEVKAGYLHIYRDGGVEDFRTSPEKTLYVNGETITVYVDLKDKYMIKSYLNVTNNDPKLNSFSFEYNDGMGQGSGMEVNIETQMFEGFDVTFKVQNGSWDDETENDKIKTIWKNYGEPSPLQLQTADIPAVGNKPDGGYREGSWSSPAPAPGTVTNDVTYTYTYAPITVTFNANGGTCTTASATVGSDGKLTSLPTATLAGHNCTGWFDENTSQTTAVTLDKVYTADTTLVAHWTETPTTYQLTVTKEGEGNVTPSSGQKNPGTTVNLTADPATNYAFVRWEATGVTISNPTDATNSFSMPSNAVTVKAIFKPIPATPVISPGTGTYPSARDVTITCDTDGAAIKYYLGETKPATPSTYSSAINISESTKLTAWSEKDGVKSSEVTATYTISSSSTDHTITVTDDGHGTGTADPSSASNDALISLSATPDGGYVFDRWTSESGVRFADPNSANTTFSMIDSDVTVKANFKQNTPTEKCTITFDKNGGSGTMNPQQVNKGTATKLKKNTFTRDGYSFKNWNTKSDGSGTSYAEEGNITANTDLTLYAQWKKNEPEPTPDPTPDKRKKDNDGSEDEHSSGSSTPSGTRTDDGFDRLRELLKKAGAEAASSGKEQTVYWKEGTSLPYDVMKMLADNPKVTLVFTYKYKDYTFTVNIPGKNAIANPSIPWYGPVYLYVTYVKGDKLSTTVQGSQTADRTYTVQKGDTLSKIARKLKVTVDHLKTVNNIKNPNKIKAGMVLKY